MEINSIMQDLYSNSLLKHLGVLSLLCLSILSYFFYVI